MASTGEAALLERAGVELRVAHVPTAVLAACAVVLIFVVEMLAVLWSTGGHFTYTLDDPYIHLALAEQIQHGHYGINTGQASSPSSSILWPFVLAVTAGMPFQEWMPLVWNLLATVGSVLVLHSVFTRRLDGWKVVAAIVAATLGLNLVGVAFTGMEHSLQVLLALLVGRGVVRLVRDNVVDELFVVATVVGPLVRYENAALSVAAAAVLLLRGRGLLASLSTLGWVVPAAGFSAFLVNLGLDPLPSSVLAKSSLVGPSLAIAVGVKAATALLQPMFLLTCAAFSVDAVVMRRWTLLHWFGAFLLAAHAVGGNFGWLGRYELYLFAGLLPVLVELADRWGLVATPRQVALGWGLIGALVVSSAPLAVWAVRAPSASADIYSQQAQTARFVADYWQRPIAVNDLGLVAYRGGQPVLDLWGLASQEARQKRFAGGVWLGPLVSQQGVDLAAIYTDWFAGQIPATWVPLATLTGGRQVASAEDTVTFYATRASAVSDGCRAVEQFVHGQPDASVAVAAVCSQ